MLNTQAQIRQPSSAGSITLLFSYGASLQPGHGADAFDLQSQARASLASFSGKMPIFPNYFSIFFPTGTARLVLVEKGFINDGTGIYSSYFRSVEHLGGIFPLPCFVRPICRKNSVLHSPPTALPFPGGNPQPTQSHQALSDR